MAAVSDWRCGDSPNTMDEPGFLTLPRGLCVIARAEPRFVCAGSLPAVQPIVKVREPSHWSVCVFGCIIVLRDGIPLYPSGQRNRDRTCLFGCAAQIAFNSPL